MKDSSQRVVESLEQSLGQLTESAGFNRMVGQIYALLYLSPERLSLGEIAEKLNASKGNVSLNTRNMEQWGMIKRINLPADRHDYFEANTDFWQVIRGILSGREKKLITNFKNSVADNLKEVKKADGSDEARFHTTRLKHLLDFINTFNRLFNAYLALERFSVGGIWMGEEGKNEK